MAKTGLAAACAWWLGQLLGQPQPIFATFAALHAIQPTVAGSLRHIGGQLVGVAAGMLLSLVSGFFSAAPEPLAIGAVVALALGATALFGASGLLGTEVAVTAGLVFMLADSRPLWALERMWEAALGGVVALVVNALIWPPDYLRGAREAVHTLARDLSEHTRAAVDDLVFQRSRERVRTHLLAARASARRAEALVGQTALAQEALRFSPLLRYSPLRRGYVNQLERCARGVETLAAALAHASTANRAAWYASRAPRRAPLAAGEWYVVVDALIEAVARFEAYADEGAPEALAAAGATLDSALQRVRALLHQGEASGEWDQHRIALLGELEHILDDLAASLQAERGSQPAVARAV